MQSNVYAMTFAVTVFTAGICNFSLLITTIKHKNARRRKNSVTARLFLPKKLFGSSRDSVRCKIALCALVKFMVNYQKSIVKLRQVCYNSKE